MIDEMIACSNWLPLALICWKQSISIELNESVIDASKNIFWPFSGLSFYLWKNIDFRVFLRKLYWRMDRRTNRQMLRSEDAFKNNTKFFSSGYSNFLAYEPDQTKRVQRRRQRPLPLLFFTPGLLRPTPTSLITPFHSTCPHQAEIKSVCFPCCMFFNSLHHHHYHQYLTTFLTRRESPFMVQIVVVIRF